MKTIYKLLILLILPVYVHAFHDHDTSDTEQHVEESFTQNLLNSTEHHLKHVYDYINDFSRTLDETITGEKSLYKYENSEVRFETFYTYRETKSNDVDFNFKVKLRLPQLKEKLKLVIGNDDNKVAEQYDDTNEVVPYKDDDFSLAVEYDKFKKYYNFKVKGGAKLNSDPYVFVNAKVSKKYDLSQTWHFLAEEKIELNTERTFENTTSFSFNKRINNRLRFVNFNQYYWNEEDQDDNTYNSLRISHKLSQRNTLEYVSAVSSNDDDTHFQTKVYDAYIAYKHYIRKWLYYDVVPALYWERDDDFKTRYAFRFNIGIIAGK